MLEIRTCCESCGKPLPADSTEAHICSFECTFCNECVETILLNVCPNCGGGFEKRPVRPKAMLDKFPASTKRVVKPPVQKEFEKMLQKYKDILPQQR